MTDTSEGEVATKAGTKVSFLKEQQYGITGASKMSQIRVEWILESICRFRFKISVPSSRGKTTTRLNCLKQV